LQIQLIKALEKDKNFLLILRKATMVQHLEASGLYLSDEEHMERINHHFEGSFLIMLFDQKVGSLKCKETIETVEILQLQVHPDFQGKGIGRSTLEKMIESVKNKNQDLTLKVLKENPAKTLYERAGFITIGEDSLEFFMKWIP